MTAARMNRGPVSMEEGLKLIYLDKDRRHPCLRYFGAIKTVFCLQLITTVVLFGFMMICVDFGEVEWFGDGKILDNSSDYLIEENASSNYSPLDSLNLLTSSYLEISVTTPSSLDNPHNIKSEIQTSDKVNDDIKSESDGTKLIDYEDVSTPVITLKKNNDDDDDNNEFVKDLLHGEIVENANEKNEEIAAKISGANEAYDQGEKIQQLDDETDSVLTSKTVDADSSGKDSSLDEIIPDLEKEIDEIATIWKSIVSEFEQSYNPEESWSQFDHENTRVLNSGEVSEDPFVEDSPSDLDPMMMENLNNINIEKMAEGNIETEKKDGLSEEFVDDLMNTQFTGGMSLSSPASILNSLMRRYCSDINAELRITREGSNFQFECVEREGTPNLPWDFEIPDDVGKTIETSDYADEELLYSDF